jgi:hypothetical protein
MENGFDARPHLNPPPQREDFSGHAFRFAIATARIQPRVFSKTRRTGKPSPSQGGLCVATIKSGVEKVSFVDGRTPHAVMLEIFTDKGVGTEVVL